MINTLTATLRGVDYLRVSTEEQAKGYGISYSGKKTARYIKSKGWDHVGTYTDDGVSGSLEAADRGDLNRLMTEVRENPRPFDVVVVNEGRAIGRVGRAFWRWVWELEDLGVFVAIRDGDVDNTTPEGRREMRRMADYAETEWETIRERTQSGIQEKAEDGGCTGNRVRFGYRIKDQGKKGVSTLVPDVCDCPGDCETVHEHATAHRAWHLLVAEHKSRDEAAFILNQEGRLTRSGEEWSGRNLGARMWTLTEEPVIVFRGARAKTGRDGNPLYGETVRIQLDPVFDPAPRPQLRAALTRRSVRRTGGHVYPLSTRLASLCGGHYAGQCKPGGDREYRCSAKQKRHAGSAVCDCPNLDAAMVEGWVWKAVCGLLEDPDRLRSMSQDWNRKADASGVDHAARVADLDQQIEVQRKAISAVMGPAAKQAVLEGRSPETVIAEATRPLKQELDQLQSLREEAAAWQRETDQAAQRARDLTELAEVARTRLHDMRPAEQAEIMELLQIEAKVTGTKGGEGTARCALAAWFRERDRQVPDLTEEAWRIAEPILAASVRRRRANALPHRQVLEAMLHKARTGLSWAQLPERFGPASGLRTRYFRWVDLGVWDQVMEALKDQPGTPPPATARPLPHLEVRGRLIPELLVGITGESEGTPTNVGMLRPALPFHIRLAA